MTTEEFAERIDNFKKRYKYPEIISIKGAMAFMARMCVTYPEVAKDGDVLANEYGSVFIYAGFEDDERVTVDNYCYITANHDKFCIEDHKTGSWYYVKELNPATKEQRDLLFQKMREAGYEWDAEKKELRKIEQKSAWSEEDEKEFEQLLDILHANGYESFDIWLKSLKERYTWKPSNEQMKAFYKYLNDGDKTLALSESILLRHLYNDLKKLK